MMMTAKSRTLKWGGWYSKCGWPAAARAMWGRDDFNSVYLGNAPWFMTGDFAFNDDEGYFFYQGRSDDVVITSAGKIGISEIAVHSAAPSCCC